MYFQYDKNNYIYMTNNNNKIVLLTTIIINIITNINLFSYNKYRFLFEQVLIIYEFVNTLLNIQLLLN